MTEKTPTRLSEELREWARGMAGGTPSLCEHVLAIADRIEAASEKKGLEDYQMGITAGMQRVADMGDNNPWLLKNGLVRLPKDKNGQTIHLGDAVSQYIDGRLVEHVSCILYYEEGVWIETDRGTVKANGVYHHKPTPAERIRKCAGWLEGCFKNHGTLDVAVLDELCSIADELEGAGE